MRYNEKNIIVDNVLSKEEIDNVLHYINESKNKINMEMYNQELIDLHINFIF